MGSNRYQVDMPTYVQMYLDGRLILDDTVNQNISLTDVNEDLKKWNEANLCVQRLYLMDEWRSEHRKQKILEDTTRNFADHRKC